MADYFFEEAPWYKYATEAKKVVIESGITSIGDTAFCDFTALEEIEIADTVTSIGMNSFSGCGLLEIYLPKSIQEIDEMLKLKTPKVTVKAGKKKFTVKYTKVKDATGFEVKYKLGKKIVTKTYDAKKTVTKTFKKLAEGKYKVQVRAFIKQGKKTAYSNWTKASTAKVKG